MSASSPIGPLDYAQKRYQRSVDRGMGSRGGNVPILYPDPQLQTSLMSADRTDDLKLNTRDSVSILPTARKEDYNLATQPVQQTQPFKAYSPIAYSPRRPSGSQVASPEISTSPDQIAQLRRKIKTLRTERDEANAERDEAKADIENMLTELLNTEARLDETQAEVSKYKNELSSLRSSHSRQQSRGGGLDINPNTSTLHSQQLQDQDHIQTQLSRLQHRLAQAETYAHHLETNQATLIAETEQSTHAKHCTTITSLGERIQIQTIEIDETKKLSDFFRMNCEAAAKKNRELVGQNRGLQDSLHAREKEVTEGRGLVEALRLRMGMEDGMPGAFPGKR